MTLRPAVLLLFAIALVACGAGQLRWEKAGASDPELQRDLSACRQQVQARYGAPGAPVASTVDPRFGPVGPTAADQRMQESQAVGSCMRGKGYALVPAGK